MLLNLLQKPESVSLHPVIALVGPEFWVRRRLRQDLIRRAVSGPFQEMNFASYDAGEEDIEAALERCRDYPCFASYRVVCLSEAGKISASEAAALISYLQDPVATTVLILEDDKLDGRCEWVKLLKKRACYVEVPEAERDDAIAWVKLCFEEEGKKAEVAVIERLLAWVGYAFAPLRMAVEQCSLYIGKRERILLQDVEALLVKTTDENLFALIDAIFSKDHSGLHRPLSRLLESGEAPLKVLSLIHRHLSLLLTVKYSGKSNAASLFRVPPAVLAKYEKQARQHAEKLTFSLSRFLASTDLQLKGSSIAAALVLKRGVEDMMRSLA